MVGYGKTIMGQTNKEARESRSLQWQDLIQLL